MIEMAMTIVGNSGGQYHVLLIIADGQVCRPLSKVNKLCWKILIGVSEFLIISKKNKWNYSLMQM